MNKVKAVKFIVDIHERDSGLLNALIEMNLDATEESLESGDVNLIMGDKSVGIEIKRDSDYATSLYEGRLGNQIYSMYEKHDFAIMIVEAWKPHLADNDGENSFKEKYHRTMKSMRTLNRDITLQETKCMDDTIGYILDIVRDFRGGTLFNIKRPVVLMPRVSDSVALLCSQAHINEVTAQKLLIAFDTPKIALESIDDWPGMKIGMTKERCEIVKKAYGSD